LEEEEVCAFYDVELGHNHQSTWFVDQSIDGLQVRGIFRHGSRHLVEVGVFV